MLEVIPRSIFTLRAGFAKRAGLRRIMAASGSLATVEVTLEKVAGTGATVVALDYDGVLAPHGVDPLSPELQSWLSALAGRFGTSQIYILSNKPKPSRVAHISSSFPGINFIVGTRKKPYPDGLIEIQKASGCRPSEIVLLDDRLLTGGLAAILAGAHFIYISIPLVSFRNHPVPELFFGVLRRLERMLVLLVG